VNSARDAVLKLQVHLWHDILVEDGGIGNITDGSGLNHVADSEPLDGLVLGSASGAVGAADGLDVATSVLVTTVGGSLLYHDCGCCCLKLNQIPSEFPTQNVGPISDILLGATHG